MFILLPHEWHNRITDIKIDTLKATGIKGLVLDVDNTLTTHDNPTPASNVLKWLDFARSSGIKCIILSNNTQERVEPFAKMLGLDFVANGKKPLSKGIKEACSKMELNKSSVAIIGDQLFTDILCGRLFGVRSILVNLIEPETTFFFKSKRFLERAILRGHKEGK